MENKLKIIAVKTKEGRFYLSEQRCLNQSWEHTYLKKYLFDGVYPKEAFHREWVFIDKEPNKITKIVNQPDINYRYELQDKSLISEKLPEFIKREDFEIYDKEKYKWIVNENMAQYKSLYKLISDKQPDKEEEIDFELEVLFEVENIINPTDMQYKVQRTQWRHEGFTNITKENVIYQLADKVILPTLLLPSRPCKLSSQDTYKIVREYIKDNINGSVASITSDYDFCFTVKKRIKKAKIETYTVDVNNSIFDKRKRKPKYVSKQKVEVLEPCFEMTYSPYNYSGYKAIEGFEANNQNELKEKIDNYLKDLIKFINTPLCECSNCNGYGVIVEKPDLLPKD